MSSSNTNNNRNLDSQLLEAAEDLKLQMKQQYPTKASVKVTYVLPDKTIEVKEFNASNTTTKQIGLPLDQLKPVKPQPGDYTYSGMHDSGPLPKLKEGGFYADMISYVLAAKDANDEYLTKIIDEEAKAVAAKEQNNNNNEITDDRSPEYKKAKRN